VKLDPRKAAEELARREANLTRARSLTAAIRGELFGKQLKFIDDKSRNKAALCTRRAGKTSMWARYCTIECLEKPGSLIRIWAINRLRAKQLLWQEFIHVAARHRVPIKTHETELTIRFENGSEIRLLGADKDKEAQKKRGDKTRMEVVLEAQLFGPFLKSLVEDVAEPCLFDLQGTMCLEGTPGPVSTGYWFWITGDGDAPERGEWQSSGMDVPTGAKTETGEDVKERVGAGWSCHRWSVLDNPHLPHAAAELEKIRAKRAWTIDTPTYMREYRGLWVKDDGTLFYKFNESRNTYTLSDVQPWGDGWKHVLGWDLGFRDDMALVAWGWHPSKRELYEAASWNLSGAKAEDVMAQIDRWEKMGFDFVAKVADTGGGGRMYVEDVMSRYSQVFEAAKKTEKSEHVRLMNDDFLSGRIKVQRGGSYAQELASLPKDPDWDPYSGKPQGEDPRFPNHLCFVAGTLVLTSEGEKPIERVRPGDLVLTRAGWRPVTRAGATGVRQVITRLGLTGTPEHPVLTDSGWKRLDLVVGTDVILYAWNSLQASSGTESSGIGSRGPSAEPTAYISSPALVDETGTCIEPSTSMPTGPSLVVGTFITATAILSTTTSGTLKRDSAESTSQDTKPSGGLERLLSSASRLLRSLARRPLSGTGPRKGERGTESTQPTLLRAHAGCVSAASVDPTLRASSTPYSVPPDARVAGTRASEGIRASTTRHAPAASAESLSPSTSTASSRTAVVYALSVADQHEYFANGVLVSNCDAALYAWRKALNYLDFLAPRERLSESDRIEQYDEERLTAPPTTEWWENGVEYADDL